MAYWLLKSEPSSYSWDKMLEDRNTAWDGVRNYQAAGNLKAMAVGDCAFFYHSGKERIIIGVVEIVRTAYPDYSDAIGRFVMVDIGVRASLVNPVTLATIKHCPALNGFAIIRQPRLSVLPVSAAHWQEIVRLAGGLTCLVSQWPMET